MKRLLSMAAAAALAGCAGSSLPPSVDGSATSGQMKAVPPGTTPMLITVERGETLYGLARRWGVQPQVVIDTNRLRPPYMLLIGQRLIMPIPDPNAPSATMVAGRSGAPAAPPESSSSSAEEYPAAAPADTPAAVKDTETAALPSPGPAPATGGSQKFIWPVAGNVVSGYGAKGDGLFNDGIDISAPTGTPVRASASGVVAYAGNELQGYGNMVLIRHSDGWMTAYAHNQELLVRRGDKVSQGQVIARVGSTGRAARSQLHFEIRRGKEAVDPVGYLPRPTA